ncbi:MAG: hypothetical protein GY882_00210 [Actinomycetia bacterium]|nr:hypothetical protein [Actinomycetes bacterium]MCP4846156.1 hypothetical protein [Actinomycetes bacterium]
MENATSTASAATSTAIRNFDVPRGATSTVMLVVVAALIVAVMLSKRAAAGMDRMGAGSVVAMVATCSLALVPLLAGAMLRPTVADAIGRRRARSEARLRCCAVEAERARRYAALGITAAGVESRVAA